MTDTTTTNGEGENVEGDDKPAVLALMGYGEAKAVVRALHSYGEYLEGDDLETLNRGLEQIERAIGSVTHGARDVDANVIYSKRSKKGKPGDVVLKATFVLSEAMVPGGLTGLFGPKGRLGLFARMLKVD